MNGDNQLHATINVTVIRRTALAVACLASTVAQAATAPSNLLSLLSSAADGSWVKASTNLFSDAWPDVSLRNDQYGYDDPSRVIAAWSSVAWDSKRGDILLYGGGHGNYGGNEMYRWNGTSQKWTLASLPSKVTPVATANGDLYQPVDGLMNAPSSAHTYDNNEYLAVADRFITLGGPAFNVQGGQYKVLPNGSLQLTGPYVFDPNKADGTKVGGTTGSGVNSATLGGNMWQNRDNRSALFNVTTWRGTEILSPLDGTSAAAVENGKDVIYFTGRTPSNNYLMRYQVTDIANPASDQMSVVGLSDTGTPYGAAGYDSVNGFYVSLTNSNSSPFVAWTTRGSGIGLTNAAVDLRLNALAGFNGASIGGIDFNAATGSFLVWTGAGDVWRLKEPSSGNITDTWTLTLETNGALLAAAAEPDGMSDAGVRGKWKYADGLNAFIAVEGDASGDVWLYRPAGWTSPLSTPVPEPETWQLWLVGLLGVASRSALRRRQAQGHSRAA